MVPFARRMVVTLTLGGLVVAAMPPGARGAVTREQVERAIRDGVRFLKLKQRADGSWADNEQGDARTGVTSLVTLALLTAGEPADAPHIARAVDYLRNFSPRELDNTYAIALQTMVFAAADPERNQIALNRNVAWLESAQIRAGDRVDWPGSWTYSAKKTLQGDCSNTQYALLGLHAAGEVGLPVKAEVWALARQYWEQCQRFDGSWPYRPGDASSSTASMTCAGISSLVITGLKRYQGQEALIGDRIQGCGQGGFNPTLQRGIDWLAAHFRVGENFGRGQTWKFYYLYGLERAGRLTGQRFFGGEDWYRRGAEELVHEQDRLFGSWTGLEVERDPLIATSFALLFLAKGRSPVVINKLRHGPGQDWDNDVDDVRNLVAAASRDWKHLLTWQVVEPGSASVEDLMQAPIAFFNGHRAPAFSAEARQHLREYVEQGGFIFAEACCGEPDFDRGFRELMRQVFPEPEYHLRPLSDDHAIWRARYNLLGEDGEPIHPLWGIEHGCRTVVVYSPLDLSCYWNQAEAQPDNVAVIKALRVGQNVLDYATGRELPPDKLDVREVTDIKLESARRGALHIAKLKHAGDWNVAPLAIPNLTGALRRPPLNFDVVINHKELSPRDPNLIHFPLVYLHGRAAVSFPPEDLEALRRHLDPGGGLLFADAACGSPAFDAAFRRLVAELLPEHPLVPIPRDDELYTRKVGFDLSKVEYTRAAGGGRDFPQLEGVQLNGRWAVIYSKYDLGCALERHSGLDCKGYTHESALQIAANIVIYATLP